MARARSLSEFQKAFSDEASCVAFLFKTLAGRFHLAWLQRTPRGGAEKPTAFVRMP